MKKTALFLVMVMVLLHIQTPIFAQIEEYSVEAQTIFKLDIADETMFSKPDAQVKRSDFTMLAATLRGYNGESVSTDPFLDINKEYYAAGSIAYLKSLGILSGYDDGNFRGEQLITYSEALIVLTKMLGYDNHAKLIGNGLSGYINMAQNLGLNYGIQLSGDSVLTQNDALKLIYNALDIPVGRVEFSAGMPIYSFDDEDNDETAMNMWLGIDKVSGVVKNVGNASITPDTVGIGGVSVGNRHLYFDDEENYYYALGKYCDVYFYNDSTDRSDKVAAIVELPQKNDVTIIKTEDVVSFDNGILKYQIEGKNSRTIKIDASFDVCLNGEPVAADKRENAFLNSDGKIIINKIDRSDISTVVMIESYLTCFVAAVNKEDMIIYGKFGRKIDLDENDPIVVYDEYSAPASFEAITVNDVLTVKSGANVTEIHICKKSESGVINRIATEENEAYVSLETKEYKLTNDQADNMNSVKLNDNVVAYFDIFGRIAYITTSSGALSYAYLYDLCPDDLEEEMYVKLYTSGGEFVNYSATDRIKVDGDSVSGINDIYTKLERGTEGNGFSQIVRYSLNSEGKINNIDTIYKGDTETDKSLHVLHKGYNDSREEISPLIWKPRGGSFEGKVLYNTSSVKFLTVPKNYTGDRDYFFTGKTMEEDDKVAFNAYVSSKEQLMPDVLLSYINTSSGTAAARVSETFRGVVKEIKTQVNSENEVETRISFDAYGGEKNLATHEKFDKDRIMAYSTTETVQDAFTRFENGEIESTYKLERGDFAEITVDSLNRIVFVRTIVKGDTGENVMDKNEGGSVYNSRFAFGFMHKNEGNVFSIALGDKAEEISAENLRYYNTGSARVYRVIEGSNPRVEKISISDVIDYHSAGMGAEKVVVYTMAGITQIIVIYGE